jgi:hypothetical protein
VCGAFKLRCIYLVLCLRCIYLVLLQGGGLLVCLGGFLVSVTQLFVCCCWMLGVFLWVRVVVSETRSPCKLLLFGCLRYGSAAWVCCGERKCSPCVT